MSGGSKSQTTTTPGATPATPGASNMMTLPGAMPGQLEAISQQLAGGFGQNPTDILTMLQQLHKPMQVQDPTKPWMAPAGTATSPTAGQTAYARSVSGPRSSRG